MKICSVCDSEMSDTDAFCLNCGTMRVPEKAKTPAMPMKKSLFHLLIFIGSVVILAYLAYRVWVAYWALKAVTG